MKHSVFTTLVFALLFFSSCQNNTEKIETEVLVIGKGTGAISAGIQSARSGATTLLANPLPWVGGMLTSAGVSATDGNHELPAGLWGEFRALLRKHYGGADSLSTGWVSHTLFEPHVGEQFWRQLAHAETNLTILDTTTLVSLIQGDNGGWKAVLQQGEKQIEVSAKIVVDGTDLGDVAALAGVAYHAGMDNQMQSNENMALVKSNDILQDLTYVAILKDYGEGQDKTIPKPASYNPEVFHCSCKTNCETNEEAHPCDKMLSYALLPNKKYMINWPIEGNDYYANVLDMSSEEREATYAKAKEHTLNFVYYIQNELGYKHLGLADDEFPTDDLLALYPYHREGRRIKGLIRFNINHIQNQLDYNLYRTGIAVGDYPIDHHHDKNSDAPTIDFPKVPSYNIPIGALIPKDVNNFVVADKAISVSNIANGTTRLQPVIIQIGQVAGIIAATSVKENKTPAELNIRQIQDQLLAQKGYLMPYIDVLPDHPHFESIQRIGATGILRGKGIAYQWANQTWFYPDTTIQEKVLLNNIKVLPKGISMLPQDGDLTVERAIILLDQLLALEDIKRFPSSKALEAWLLGNWTKMGLKGFQLQRPLTKAELAVLLDKIIDPFHKLQIDVEGNWK